MQELTIFNVSGVFVIEPGVITGHAFAGRPSGHAVEASVTRPCSYPVTGEQLVLFAARIEDGKRPAVRTLQILDRDPALITHPDVKAAVTDMMREIESKVGRLA